LNIASANTYLEFFTGLQITGETLEDRLAYDYIFVEYFNAFLALPVRH